LLWTVENKNVRSGFLVFFCFSFIAYLIVLYWIPRVMVKYGNTTWWLGIIGLVCLAAFLSLFAGLAGMLIRKNMLSGSTPGIVFWIAVIWIAKDLLIEKIFGGFPWCLIGYSQYKNIYFTQVAEIAGVHLISFLIVSINVLFYRLLKTKSKKILVAILTVFLFVYVSGHFLLHRYESQTREIPLHQAGIIQPNSNHDQIFDFVFIKKVLESLFYDSLELKKQGAELVIWPEFTVPIYPLQTPYYKNQFSEFSRRHIPLLAGFTDFHNSESVFNSVMLFKGDKIEKYDKFHLTPFGEYVLFRRWLFFVKKITDEIGDFTPGKSLHNLSLAGHWLATPLCYEIIYPELTRTMVARGAELIVTISNDSWFGNTAAPYQHLAMAVFRSIENRRYLLRSTSNGISALVDPAGRIIHQSPLHKSDRFLASFKYLKRKTIFTRWGYLFPYMCFFLTLGNGLWLILKKRK
jgi:apolipoprotein N-acyltransferase